MSVTALPLVKRLVGAVVVLPINEECDSPAEGEKRDGCGDEGNELSRGHDNYRIASIPLLSTRARSLREGPLGCASPRSHLLTRTFVTFNARAKVAWLM